MMSKKERGNVD